MTGPAEQGVEERLLDLQRRLGIEQAHYVARVAVDYTGFVAGHPDRIASLAVVCPPGLYADVLKGVASRLLLIQGDRGPNVLCVPKSIANLPGASQLTLHDYFDADWSDVAADRTEEVGGTLLEFLARHSISGRVRAVEIPEGEGEVADLTYRVRGAGPPVFLLPLALAPHQWEPLVPILSQRYCTIVLGGAALGYVAVMEDRTSSPGYIRLFWSLIDEVQLQPGETVLDVGCGTASLDRWLARHTSGANPIMAVDVNRYLLREAAGVVKKDGLDGAITFMEGSAEALPFPDNSLDAAVSVTVMEEVEADRMLAEMVRVTKPGGRVAVAVRAEDRSWWVNLPLPPGIKAKVENSAGGGAAERGCADAGLYRRFQEMGLSDVKKRPQLVSYEAAGTYAQTLQSQILARLDAKEAEDWLAALARAEAEGTFFIARPYHCAIGTKRAQN